MKAINFVAFVAGAVIGSVATLYYTKNKYERIAQEEIDSVKAAFSKKKKEEDPEQFEGHEDEKEESSMSVSDYAKILSKEKYTNYSTSSVEKPTQPKKVEEPILKADPYVISPEEFGSNDYDEIGFTYYADHILTDDGDEILEDVEGSIGFDSLNHFGEYDDDVVYVRNDRLKVDYEIVKDLRTYSEVLNDKPWLRREE